AYHPLAPLLGGAAAGIFLVSLLASGVSSATVGTLAGQMIMQGFIGFRIPLWVRRLVTMIPAFVVVGLGIDATNALVISQGVLSITLPLPMIALLKFTRRPDGPLRHWSADARHSVYRGEHRADTQRTVDPTDIRRSAAAVARRLENVSQSTRTGADIRPSPQRAR